MSQSEFKCDCSVIHEVQINEVKNKMFEDELLFDLADFFKVLGDSTRIRIICALFESELCVCDIASVLNMTQSAISHQLKTLKQARLVKSRRDGKTMYYALDDEHVQKIFDLGIIHLTHE
jgi:DNA-binding transcriptional ArsR family regulator